VDFNWKLLLLGAVPPILGIVGELLNPVSPQKARKDAQPALDTAIAGSSDDVRARNFVGDTLERTVKGAIKAASLLPTWISANAGIAGMLVEMLSPSVAASVTLVIVALTALPLPWFFGRIDYYAMAERRPGTAHHASTPRPSGVRAWIARTLGSTRGELLQRLVVYVNIVVIAVALIAALTVAPSAPPQSGSSSPAALEDQRTA
jgi:hypothetical protein